MPTIAGDLNGFALYAWVPSIYLLTSAVSTPIYGKVADLFGRKHVLFFGIGLFLLGSITSGAATSIQLLILFRGIQGLGAGAVQPVTMTIIGDLFSLERRARIQGLFGSVWGISSVLGPLLGGTMVDNIGWRWIFYINIPVGILAVAMIGGFFHERSVPRRHTLDLAGATYLTAGLTALLLLFIESGSSWPWLSWQTAALTAGTLLSLVLFLFQERRTPEPVLPLDLFRIRIIAVSTLAAMFSGGVMIAITFEIPLYVQGVLGQDAFHAGLALAPMSIGWPLASSFSGRLAIRYGYRLTALIGSALIVIGVGFLLTLGLTGGFARAMALSFLIGAGMGLSTTPMMIAVQSAVGWARRGIATSTTIFMRSFGGVVGLAIMGAIINNATGSIRTNSSTNAALRLSSSVPPAVADRIHRVLLDGIHSAFQGALIAAVITLAIVGFLPGGSAKEHEVQEESVQTATQSAHEAAS